MKLLNLSSICNFEYIENRENNKSCVAAFENVDKKVYSACCDTLLDGGFEKKETYENGNNSFCFFSKDNFGVFVNYYGATREMRIVEEEDCLYFSYSDSFGGNLVTPKITQVKLEDYGMSYVIRLSDGRFIVIDGGRELEPDRDRLFKTLKKGANGEKPVIAAWIMTHPHADHFNCFNLFMDNYADEIILEKVLLNFPEADDLEHYPKLTQKHKLFADSSPFTNIPMMYERISQTGAPIYMAHTGQRYVIGDAKCEILSSMDDTIHNSDNINSTSLVIRMELGGQTILWATDSSFEHARLPERYGSYLKADILQVPHHGFGNGAHSEQIKGFELIRPSVCLLPVSDYNAYVKMCTYREGTSHLMNMPCVREIITGETQRSITLPYTPSENARGEIDKKFMSGRAACGSCVWVYSDLSTACEEDFEFTLLNMTTYPADISIDLYFENAANEVRYIKYQLSKNALKRLNIVGEEVDGDAVYFNWLSLKGQGIPENARFSVRFMSDKPIVVSHEKHKAAYVSPVC